MANDPTQVIVAGDATLYVATAGTALAVPAGLAAPGTAWLDAGYLHEDGATFTLSRTTEDINVWQDQDPVRTIITAFTKSIATTLRQWNPTNIKFALGGGSVVLGGTAAFGTYFYPAPDENTAWAVILDTKDGGYTTRFYYPRVQIGGDLEVALGRTDSMNLPINMRTLSAATKPEIRSNLPSFL